MDLNEELGENELQLSVLSNLLWFSKMAFPKDCQVWKGIQYYHTVVPFLLFRTRAFLLGNLSIIINAN